ncbi:lipoyl(octanoyl) transferase LipB [Helcobacillus massiliensis]|uniref:Octanoyltransferase n=1 Tax=Helcobacillus massiliensis TaxID=521392 RepID=A0A839QS34_9MICO|nr:lipoyl(octanoyl) transferase [Helcobacillus massiliensis]
MLEIIRVGFSEDSGLDSTHEQWGLPPGPVEYRAAWDLQRRIHAEVVGGERPNTLLLLEHQPVYTAGKRTIDEERPQDGAPVVDVDRGGKITWHGPEQLVGYPIVKLPPPIDVVGFVRGIEEAIMAVCDQVGVNTVPIEGRSGVWVPDPLGMDRKVCAIGLRVSKRATMHGFALNCANDLSWSHNVIPCGIDDAGVTSLSVETGCTIRPADVIHAVEEQMRQLEANKGLD